MILTLLKIRPFVPHVVNAKKLLSPGCVNYPKTEYNGDSITYENPVFWAGEAPTNRTPNARQMALDYARETEASHLHHTPIGHSAEEAVSRIRQSLLSEGAKQRAIDEVWEIACKQYASKVSGEATVILKNPIQGNAYHRFEEEALKKNLKIHKISVTDLSDPSLGEE